MTIEEQFKSTPEKRQLQRPAKGKTCGDIESTGSRHQVLNKEDPALIRLEFAALEIWLGLHCRAVGSPEQFRQLRWGPQLEDVPRQHRLPGPLAQAGSE